MLPPPHPASDRFRSLSLDRLHGRRQSDQKQQRRMTTLMARLPSFVPATYGTGSNLKPPPQRLIWPEDGDGKCAVQTKVDVSHRQPNSLRRDSPACSEL